MIFLAVITKDALMVYVFTSSSHLKILRFSTNVKPLCRIYFSPLMVCFERSHTFSPQRILRVLGVPTTHPSGFVTTTGLLVFIACPQRLSHTSNSRCHRGISAAFLLLYSLVFFLHVNPSLYLFFFLIVSPHLLPSAAGAKPLFTCQQYQTAYQSTGHQWLPTPLPCPACCLSLITASQPSAQLT